ncbi:MAG: dTDP-glucose 4,6-dehydratase [Caldilineaceae bacterium SB0662_bin_25]|nr:dTDP-glucose 4,6-dehydratase [Caldilineaceae bacterium SB0662_bin_25]
MQNVLVTGGAGFIGCNFVRYILENSSDIEVTVYDKLTYAGRLENLDEVREGFGPRYFFVKGDICDAAKVEETVAARKIDTIVNFAAETHVDRSILDPDAFVKTDVYGTYVLLEAARKFGNLRFHQISTDEVYGHIEGRRRSVENDAFAPRSPYSASKASADLFVNAYHITYDLPVTISRGANNIGPYQYPEKVVPLFVTNALESMPLPVYGDGMQMRDYQYVADHCAAIHLILREGSIGETYNIGSGAEMTNLAMVEILLDELEKPRSLIQHVEDRQGHDRRYSLDVSRIMGLGWEPDYAPEEAIRSTARWYRDNRWWWQPIRDGDFKDYYEKVYAGRKKLKTN